MKLTISQILGTYDKTKDGTPLIIKSGKQVGKPYQKANVKFTETGDKVVSMNIWSGNKCEIGQIMEGDITEREWQGKKYYDFKAINKDTKQEMEIGQIKFSLAKHDMQIKEIQEFIRQQFPRETARKQLESEIAGGYPVSTGQPNFDDANAELETISMEENENVI